MDFFIYKFVKFLYLTVNKSAMTILSEVASWVIFSLPFVINAVTSVISFSFFIAYMMYCFQIFFYTLREPNYIYFFLKLFIGYIIF